MRSLGTVETDGSFVMELHWVRPTCSSRRSGDVPSRAVAINPQTREVLAVHDLGGTILYAEETGERARLPRRSFREHRPRSGRRLRRKRASQREARRDHGGLGTGRGLGRGRLPGAPVGPRARGRPVGLACARRPRRRARRRGRPRHDAGSLPRPHRAGLAARPPARLARARRAREDDRRARSQRRLATLGPGRGQREHLRVGGRHPRRHAGRPLPHRPVATGAPAA